MIICFLSFTLTLIGGIRCLSGHVCKRERAETYMTSYNQAFLCQERYTTSCGHLDWRRCTRYRVQTCYTPRERYAIKYHVVETCCPGWSDDGTGACAIANCGGSCQNEGRCSDVSGTPTCICQDSYYGDHCQHERNHWEGWQTAVVCSCGILVVVVTAITVCVYRRFSKKKMKRIAPTNEFLCWNQPARFVIPSGLPVQARGTSNREPVQSPQHVAQTSNNQVQTFSHPSGSLTVQPSAPIDCFDT